MLEQIRQRLSLLPLHVPVLSPEDALIPAEWQEESEWGDIIHRGESGLHIYFKQKAPSGYVQLHDPRGGTSTGTGGWADRELLQIDVIAPNREHGNNLAGQVRRLMAGSPRGGGRWSCVTPPFVMSADPISVRIVMRFSVLQAQERTL